MKIVEKPQLPKEIFNVSVAPQLLAQAARVYLANQRQGTQSSLTRAEVARTRKKLYKQKGTGGARHGDRKAPIFVGGGVAFAPKPRDYSLRFSSQMRKKALSGALTTAVKEKKLVVVSEMEKMTGKTKELVRFLDETTDTGSETKDRRKEKGKWLVVTDKARENVYRAGRNIPEVKVLPVSQINTYEVLRADRVLMMEEAVPLVTTVTTVTPVTTEEVPSKTRAVKTVKKVPKPVRRVTKTGKKRP